MRLESKATKTKSSPQNLYKVSFLIFVDFTYAFDIKYE